MNKTSFIVIPLGTLLIFALLPALHILGELGSNPVISGLPESIVNRAQINNEAQNVFSRLEELQEQYFAEHNRYFQGIPTDDILFTAEAPVAVDETKKPDDQAENWQEFGFPRSSTLVSYSIDVYDGPNGKGYTLQAAFEQDGARYHVSRHRGPENYRDTHNNIWIAEVGGEF